MKRWSIVLVALLGCGPAQPVAQQPAPSVIEVAATTPASGAGQAETVEHCVFRAEPPSCSKSLSAKRTSALDTRIAALKNRVLESEYRDADALVELSRLQLLRGSDPSDAGNPTGHGAKARRNAMRALAVDATAQSRLVMALSTARQLPKAMTTGVSRALAFEAAQLGLPQQDARGSAAAAALVLRGYQQLASGQPKQALDAFQRASRLDPNQALAWRGLGDVERNRSDWDAAIKAYDKARALAPGDKVLQRSLAAAKEQRPLLLPAHEPAPIHLKRTPLAEPFPAASPCSAAAKANSESKPMCDALDELLAASTPTARGEAALKISRTLRDMRSLCSDGDPACGPHVLGAMMAAINAFNEARAFNKSIALNRMLLVYVGELPGGNERKAQLTLHLADRYLQLGTLDMARRYYERQVRVSHAGAAAEQTLGLRIALGETVGLDAFAQRLLRKRTIPAEQRARWVVAIAELLQAHEGQQVADRFLARHETLLTQHPVPRSAPPTAAPPCDPALLCAHEQLISNGGWSPASARKDP